MIAIIQDAWRAVKKFNEALKGFSKLRNDQLDYTYQRAPGVEDIDKFTFAIRALYNFRAAVADFNDRHETDLYQHIFADCRDEMIEEAGRYAG